MAHDMSSSSFYVTSEESKPLAKFAVSTTDADSDLNLQRVRVDFNTGTTWGLRLDLSRTDALTLARLILSKSGFVLDGAAR
jgi:hypothetical protein